MVKEEVMQLRTWFSKHNFSVSVDDYLKSLCYFQLIIEFTFFLIKWSNSISIYIVYLTINISTLFLYNFITLSTIINRELIGIVSFWNWKHTFRGKAYIHLRQLYIIQWFIGFCKLQFLNPNTARTQRYCKLQTPCQFGDHVWSPHLIPTTISFIIVFLCFAAIMNKM